MLRQVLKRAKLWYRLADEYSTLRNRKPPVGRALTAAEQQHLFSTAQTKPGWIYRVHRRDAVLLLRHASLRDQGPALAARRLAQRPDPHPALEDARRLALPELNPRASRCCVSSGHEPHARLHGAGTLPLPVARQRQEDRSRPADESWRTAWRSMRTAAGLDRVRFHDGRHTAITSPRREGAARLGDPGAGGSRRARDDEDLQPHPATALDEAADALEPAKLTFPSRAPEPQADRDVARGRYVTGHVTIGRRPTACADLSRKLAPRAGFEPATLRLTAGCSAIELPRNTVSRCGISPAAGPPILGRTGTARKVGGPGRAGLTRDPHAMR